MHKNLNILCNAKMPYFWTPLHHIMLYHSIGDPPFIIIQQWTPIRPTAGRNTTWSLQQQWWRQPFFGLPAPSVKNCRSLLEQSFTACLPLLMVTVAFGLWSRQPVDWSLIGQMQMTQITNELGLKSMTVIWTYVHAHWSFSDKPSIFLEAPPWSCALQISNLPEITGIRRDWNLTVGWLYCSPWNTWQLTLAPDHHANQQWCQLMAMLSLHSGLQEVKC